MDDLIRRKATGSPDEFAEKLGLRKSVLMQELLELKELGAKVNYCRIRKSYYYEQDFVVRIETLNHQRQQQIKGGTMKIVPDSSDSSITGMSPIIFIM
jgi:hypothetical protein